MPKQGLAGAREAARCPACVLLSSRTIGDSGERRRRSSSSETGHTSRIDLEGRRHQRQWLLFATLSAPKPQDCRFISGICDQLKTAQALKAENISRANDILRLPESLVAASENVDRPGPRIQVAVRIADRRSAARGICGWPDRGIRDRIRSHIANFSHRCVGPVVGQRLDDREARAAVRAVGERVPIATIARIKDFTKTVRAGRNVGQDERRLFTAFVAVADLEVSDSRPDREWRTPDSG